MQSLTASGADASPKEAQYWPVERFYELAPKKPYCTDLKSSGLIIRSRDIAFTCSYVQHNPPALCHWLTFDQDHDDILRWEAVNLPEPNLIVRNLENRRAHISYAIESVCTSEAARPKPLAYAQAIQEAYCEKLQADPGYTGLITKNPMHADWHVWEIHKHVYTLGELAKYVELQPRYWTRKRSANYDHYGLGRNCALFHRLRFWAYDWVAYYRDETGTACSEWMQIVLEKAEVFNEFPQPLCYGEIKSTAKSVGKWVWEKYFPAGKRKKRGAMASMLSDNDLPMDLATKQRLSARRTNQERKSSTVGKITQAIGLLRAQGTRVSQLAVSQLTGIHKNTLNRYYRHLFKP